MKCQIKRVLIAANIIGFVSMFVLCLYFFGETTSEAAVLYTYRLDFPEHSVVTQAAQNIFHFMRIAGWIAGILGTCYVQNSKNTPFKIAVKIALPFIVLGLALTIIFWKQMIINLIWPMLLCLESMLLLYYGGKFTVK